MTNRPLLIVAGSLLVLLSLFTAIHFAAENPQPLAPTQKDSVQEAQIPRQVEPTRPEQQKTAHDQSNVFSGANAPASSSAFENQPDKGRMEGFDFARDGLNAKRPMQPAEEIMKQDIADRPKVTAAQRSLLEGRYDLTPRPDASAKMSRGKPLAVGPTARLPSGVGWDKLGAMGLTKSTGAAFFPTPLCRTRSTPPAEWCSRKFRLQCFRGWSASTSSSTYPKRSCRNFLRRSFFRAALNSVMYRAARSSRSTIFTVSSRIS